jgi:hypothetical protein
MKTNPMKTKRKAKTLRTLGALGLLAAPLFAGAGCVDYKYYEIHVTFDNTTGGFDTNTTQDVELCQVTASGAASDSFPLPPGRCPNKVRDMNGFIVNPFDSGTFQFSTLQSGTVTFKLEAYTGAGRDETCKTGEGSVTVMQTGVQPFRGELKITRIPTGKTCNNSTPLMDASIDL